MNFFDARVAPSNQKHGYSLHIEQYRGLCALLVLAAHAFGDESLLLTGFKWPVVMHYFSAGNLSVLVFFCISGYVIGLTNDRKNLNIKEYLKKRAIRLYPIYLFAILLCIIAVGSCGMYTLLGNILFLQNGQPYFHFLVPIFANYPAWSLNYEVLYYLVFILVFALKPKLWALLLILLALSIILLHAGNLLFLSSYINGYYFWIMGLIIAWNVFKTGEPQYRKISLLSILFLHLCMHHLVIGEIILRAAGIHTPTNLNLLFDLPFCLMVMSTLTARHSAFLKYNKILAYSLPAFVFIYLILHHRITEDLRWIMCLIFWILSLAFYFEKKISAFLLERLTGVGRISYALYLLHVPVALLIRKTVFISNIPEQIIVKYSLWLSITFTLSYLLERKAQPVIKKYLVAA
ncbi:MAG TPA: acyltransferase [Mucilaginibacter sp.]|nr:acyltransferase [Mucilaginibacter sp.]